METGEMEKRLAFLDNAVHGQKLLPESAFDSSKLEVRMLIRDISEFELRSGCGLCNAPGL